MAAAVGGDDSPRIDMTPMVDLGFLLLTFFILTTTLNTPVAMPIVVPPKIENPDKVELPPVAASKVLNLLIGGDDVIYYYQGVEGEEEELEMNSTGYSAEGLRETIYEYRRKVNAQFGLDNKGRSKFIVVIKMSDDAVYKNMVDVLDEMKITQQGKYVLDKITEREIEMIENYKENGELNIEQVEVVKEQPA